MPESKPIPVRLSDELTSRLDAVANSIGSNRAALIRLCTSTFIDYLEKAGASALPMDWRQILESMDGRRNVVADEPSKEPLPPARPVKFVAKRPARKKPKTEGE